MSSGAEHYAFGINEFAQLRDEVLSEDEARAYRSRMVGGTAAGPKRWLTTMKHIECKLTTAVTQRAMEEYFASELGDAVPSFGRYVFTHNGSPRDSNDLELGWRVATSAIDNAWPGTSAVVDIGGPFRGALIRGPSPLGSIFILRDTLLSIAFSGGGLAFRYPNRELKLNLHASRIEG